MNTIIRHIEYLLSRTDCVIVPNLGAFLAHFQSARIDSEGGIMLPPQRVFTFNSGLSHNDGTLACSIARAQGISYDAALDQVYAGVQEIQQRLHRHGELVLGRVGQLIYEPETDTVQFFPATTDMLTPSSAWLPIVKKPQPKPVAEFTAAVSAQAASPWRKAARLAASIALLLIIGFVASTPITVDDAALASLYPELRQATVDELLPPPPAIVGTITVYQSAAPELSIDVDAKLRQLEESACNYLLIVGSFATRDEAERYIAYHKEAELGIYQADNRCRVYAGRYATEIEAYRALHASPFAKQGAWVCKK